MVKTLRGELIRAFVVIGILIIALSITVNGGILNTKNNIANLRKFVVNEILNISNSQVQFAQYSGTLLTDLNSYTSGQVNKYSLNADLNNLITNISNIKNVLDDFKNTKIYPLLKQDLDSINENMNNLKDSVNNLSEKYDSKADSDKVVKINFYVSQIQNKMSDFSNKYSQAFYLCLMI